MRSIKLMQQFKTILSQCEFAMWNRSRGQSALIVVFKRHLLYLNDFVVWLISEYLRYSLRCMMASYSTNQCIEYWIVYRMAWQFEKCLTFVYRAKIAKCDPVLSICESGPCTDREMKTRNRLTETNVVCTD